MPSSDTTGNIRLKTKLANFRMLDQTVATLTVPLYNDNETKLPLASGYCIMKYVCTRHRAHFDLSEKYKQARLASCLTERVLAQCSLIS